MLEHDPQQCQWRIRYIRRGEPADEYGGVVVLANPEVLSGCVKGELVEVHGRMAGHDRDPDAPPVYSSTKAVRPQPSAR
jgi:hypothetical protein